MDYEQIVLDTKRNGGGTYEIATALPAVTGFAVAGIPGATTARIDVEEFSTDMVQHVIRHNPTARYLGTWVDRSGNVWVEPCDVFVDGGTALDVANARGEACIYDLDLNQEVIVNPDHEALQG